MKKQSIKDISTMTKASHDSILYRVVTNMTEHLRIQGISDNKIEKFIIQFVKDTIKEV